MFGVMIARMLHNLPPFVILSLLLLALPSLSFSGQWKISPTRIDLDQENKNGELSVVNEGDEKVNLQIKGVEWKQDSEGKDTYKDTFELIFFPKLLTLDKNEEKVIRAGVQAVPAAREKTFRLMVQEIPAPKKTAMPTVAIALKFAVPVFVKPVREEYRGVIDKIESSHGSLSVLVKNTGNSHFKIATVEVRGKNAAGVQTFSRTVDGWYLLNGASRTYMIPLPAAECAQSSTLEVSVKTDRVPLDKSLPVDKATCSP
jgi:fimbrial chaperone protein